MESGRRAPPKSYVSVALSCMVCGARNYKTTRTRREGGKPLALKKFCKHCNQHTEHREAR